MLEPRLEQVDQKLKEFAERRAALVEAFLIVYPDLCAQAPERHRGPALPPTKRSRSKRDE
jgi:acyl carrier protein phosphodiesterase